LAPFLAKAEKNKNGKTGCLLRVSGEVEQGGWRCHGPGAE
jgi:hypothetical protein